MKKILFIHSDKKFLKFSSTTFENKHHNEFLITSLNNDFNLKGFKYKVTHIPSYHKNFRRAVKFINKFDYVIIYNLDNYKIALVNAANKNIKFIWRFFGTEMYSLNIKAVLSEKSLTYINQGQGISFREYVKNKIKKIFFNYSIELSKAALRIDYFAGLSVMEYDYLCHQHFELPNFVKLPIYDTVIKTTKIKKLQLDKRKSIIIGNSKNISNNHLDIYPIIRKHASYEFIIPFNYGTDSQYSNQVETVFKDKCVFIKDFMPYDDYINLIKSSSAYVINSFRQSAMGNIYLALLEGLKVYMNPKNIMFHELINDGFLIFDINNLNQDLKRDEVVLKKSEMKHNRSLFFTKQKEYNVSHFLKKINLD